MMSRLVWWLFGWTYPFLLWLQPSLSGDDGKSSSRKIGAAIFMVLIVTTTSKLLLKESVSLYHIYLLCVLVVSFLLVHGIITVQNMIVIWKSVYTKKKLSKP